MWNTGPILPIRSCFIMWSRHPGRTAAAMWLYPVEPGIFVREFTLFYGERLTWFITEVQEDGTELATPDRSYLEENEEKLVTGTKYADIYEMARILSERDLPELEEKMREYARKNFLVETLFSLK